MRIVPRDYQEAAHDAIYDYFRSGKKGNPLVALPTGTGKAVLIAMFVERALTWYPSTKIMVLTHVKELIKQNFDKLLGLWPTAPAGVYSSGLKRRDHQYPITFAGIQSVKNRTQLFGHLDLILIDEAHLVGDGDTTSYLTFIANAKKINPHLKVIGLTATKWRMGMGLLTNGKIFDDICFDLTDLKGFNWFLSEGYLKPLIPQPTTLSYDLSGVGTQGGEYVQSQLQDAMDVTDLNLRAVREIMEKGHDRKHWLIFTSGVEHAEHISDLLDSQGIRSVAIHSKMGDDHRDAAILGWFSGQYQAAVNYGVLTTGIDFPEIDLIAVLRPSKSAGLWVQMLGRGTRPVYKRGIPLDTRNNRLQAIYEGTAPNCLVLDFAGNTLRLGPINDPVLPKQKGAGGGGTAPVKQCQVCGTYIHISVTVCPYCHAEIPRELKISSTASTAELIKQNEVAAPAVVIESFDVTKVTYQTHRKQGKPDSLKVTYYTSKLNRRFDEWILLEHTGGMRGRAAAWWLSRAVTSPPATIAEALERLGELQEPAVIRVRTDEKYPTVVGYDKFQSRSQTLATALGV